MLQLILIITKSLDLILYFRINNYNFYQYIFQYYKTFVIHMNLIHYNKTAYLFNN